MSDNPVRLELLGEMIRRLQADVRTLRRIPPLEPVLMLAAVLPILDWR